MSYFPPPPPAPPPAAQNNYASNYTSNINGFRSRGRGGYRGRGLNSRAGPVNQASYAYRKPVSNTRDYERNYGHHSGSVCEPNPQYGALSHQSLKVEHAVPASSAFKQPQLPQHVANNPRTIQAYPNSERNGFNIQNGGRGHYASPYGTGNSRPEPPIKFQQTSSVNSQPGAIVGPAPLQGTPKYTGWDGQYDEIHSGGYPEAAMRKSHVGEYGHAYGAPYLNGLPRSHNNPNNTVRNYNGRGQKRGHGEAFGRGKAAQGPSRYQAAPAVPSFGEPILPSTKPPLPQGDKKPSPKKKRKHNQLGLTPKTEEHESSEDDDEDFQDEETSLAAAASNGTYHSSSLQISYRGQTSILQSLSDIAAWIAERKRRFPTKARIAEAAEQKKQREQARRKVELSQQKRRDEQISEAKEKRKQNSFEERAEQEEATERRTAKEGPEAPEDATARRRQKVEKLRRRLENEERRIAKAESRSKRKRSPSPVNPEEHRLSEGEAKLIENPDITTIAAPDLSPSTSQLQQPGQAFQADLESATPKVEASASDSEISQTDSDDSEDLTSSSGSESSDSVDIPEEKTSKIDERKLVPPKRDRPQQPCKYFMASGRCRSGSSCRFKHELPARGSRTAKAKENEASRPQPARKKERLSLYQRLVNQEKKNEEEAVLRAIIQLGDKGVLDQAVQDGGSV